LSIEAPVLPDERLIRSFGKVRMTLIGAVLPLAFLASPAPTPAEVVADFSFELKNLKPYGAYTMAYHEWSYDTTGAFVPPWARQFLRLPAGISLRPQFFRKRFLCDVAKLRDTRSPETCRKAQIGKGTVRVRVFSATDKTPLFGEPIPGHVYFFLTKPAKGAAFSFVNFGVPDASAPVVKNNPVVRDTRAILQANVFNDPTPDGLFGYRVELPVTIGGLPFSDERVDVTFPGRTLRRGVRRCVTPSRGQAAARCRKRRTRVKRIFWGTPPTCPASGKLTFQAFYSFLGLQPRTITHQIPCPRFPR
jgi:hypothetical protein